MNLVPRFAALLILGVSLSGCVTARNMQVKIEYDHEASFADLETFRFASSAGHDTTASQRVFRSTREALAAELEERGYQRADEDTADFWVSFDLILRGEKSDETLPGSQADAVPAGARGYSTSGTLIVKIMVGPEQKVIWHGVLTGLEPDPVQGREEIKKAAWQLLAEFPPLQQHER